MNGRSAPLIPPPFASFLDGFLQSMFSSCLVPKEETETASAAVISSPSNRVERMRRLSEHNFFDRSNSMQIANVFDLSENQKVIDAARIQAKAVREVKDLLKIQKNLSVSSCQNPKTEFSSSAILTELISKLFATPPSPSLNDSGDRVLFDQCKSPLPLNEDGDGSSRQPTARNNQQQAHTVLEMCSTVVSDQPNRQATITEPLMSSTCPFVSSNITRTCQNGHTQIRITSNNIDLPQASHLASLTDVAQVRSCLVREARAADANNDKLKALNCYRQALLTQPPTDPKQNSSAITDAEIFDECAQLFFANNLFEVAAVAFEKACAADDQNASTWYRRGVTYLKLDDRCAAQKCFEQVVCLQPNDTMALFQLALISRDRNDYNATEEYCRRLLAIEPSHMEGTLLLVELLELKSEFDEATKVLEKLMEGNDDNIGGCRKVRLALSRLKSSASSN